MLVNLFNFLEQLNRIVSHGCDVTEINQITRVLCQTCMDYQTNKVKNYIWECFSPSFHRSIVDQLLSMMRWRYFPWDILPEAAIYVAPVLLIFSISLLEGGGGWSVSYNQYRFRTKLHTIASYQNYKSLLSKEDRKSLYQKRLDEFSHPKVSRKTTKISYRNRFSLSNSSKSAIISLSSRKHSTPSLFASNST